ncbi:tetratricopeptide repeat protein [Lysobacter claricitrinus]|uniref:tetratricopeptide repeat protein n=1 Tax=Lysobacter claricitrinus TaxID=3367728 RepID=UPI0037DA8FA0
MKTGFAAATAALLLVAGAAQAKGAITKTDTAMYEGQAPQAAAKALLDAAMVQTEGGSWERIGVGRVLYLGGRKSDAQAIFDQVLAGKHDAGDVYRIARVYAEAHDWAKAKPMFDQFLAMGDFDEKELSEIGAYYLLNGDRATAENYFRQAIARDPKSTWASMRMAGAYMGVEPQP